MKTSDTWEKIVGVFGEPYRAKDVTMSATVDTQNRTVFLTGAIDSMSHDILVRVELPSSGIWHVVKAETNLTPDSWTAWQISLGEGTTLEEGSAGFRNICQQFSGLYVSDAKDRFCFYDGEIRPGEPVLKQFTLNTKIPRIVMSHNRSNPGLVPSNVSDEAALEMIRKGFATRPYIESWVQANIV